MVVVFSSTMPMLAMVSSPTAVSGQGGRGTNNRLVAKEEAIVMDLFLLMTTMIMLALSDDLAYYVMKGNSYILQYFIRNCNNTQHSDLFDLA